MTFDVVISKVNELYVRLLTNKSIAYELNEHFSYFVEGYKFMPKYKDGTWDGKIRLFNVSTRLIYSGLIPDVIEFCKKYNYTYEIADDVKSIDFVSELKAFVKRIPEFCTLVPYDYQIESFLGSIIENKSLILSPTGSGKSFIIYLIVNFLLEHTDDNILLVVPTTSLVEQMVGDFVDYDPTQTFESKCHKIYSGKDKIAPSLIKLTFEDGSVFTVPDNQLVKTVNRGTVLAKDLTCDDDLESIY